jgi:hypothetical protein
MAKRLAVVVPVMLLVASFALSSPVSTAFAHSSAQAYVHTTAHTSTAPQTFCQGPYYLVVDLNPRGFWQRDCSGSYTVEKYAYGSFTSRWSGTFYVSPTGPGGGLLPINFCNQENIGFPGGNNAYLYYVYMSPTKEPWC